MKLNHELPIEMLTRNYDLYIEAREDRYYSSMVTAAWYKELQTFIKSVSQYEGTIQDVPVLLHSGGSDKITNIIHCEKVANYIKNFQNFNIKSGSDCTTTCTKNLNEMKSFYIQNPSCTRFYGHLDISFKKRQCNGVFISEKYAFHIWSI